MAGEKDLTLSDRSVEREEEIELDSPIRSPS